MGAAIPGQLWIALVSPEICYIMTSRDNVQVNNRERGQEVVLDYADIELPTPGLLF